MGKKQPQQQYVIREIIDRKDQKTSKGGITTYYKVLWQGYPDQQATWEKATNLQKSPAVKKDIEKFNNKRKLIQKIKSPLPLIKTAKQNTKNQKVSDQTKPQPQSLIQPKNKKQTKAENKFKSKPPKNISVTIQKADQNEIITEQPKKPEQKNDVVVNKILQKMRQNITNKKLERQIINEEKIKQLGDKLKDKVKPVPKNKKNTKEPTNITTEKILQSKFKKSQKLLPIIQQKLPQNNDVPIETVPQNQTAVQTGSVFQSKVNQLLAISSVDRILDQIIQQKSSEQKQAQKPNENKSVISEKIKLQLTDQLVDNFSFKGKQSIVGPEVQNFSCQSNQFVIKGMMACKNQYFYLVEENGKSQILSRAVMLDKYPYELIVFYEKRINIKPAEINLMVL